MARPIRTIPELVDDAARANGARTWLIADDGSFTFEETRVAAQGVAGALARHGVRAGDIVLLVAHNTAADVLAWLGILRLGAIALPVNPKSTAAELAGFLDQVAPSIAIWDPAVDIDLAHACEMARVAPTDSRSRISSPGSPLTGPRSQRDHARPRC